MTQRKTTPQPPTLLRLGLADVRPLDWYGVGCAALAEACGVTPRTAERWKAERAMPATAELCWRMRQGELGLIDASFAGFTLARGFLWTVGDAGRVTAGQVEALPITMQLVADAQQRLREAADARRAEVRLADERRAAGLLSGFQATCAYALPTLRITDAPAVEWSPTGTAPPAPEREPRSPPPRLAASKRLGRLAVPS